MFLEIEEKGEEGEQREFLKEAQREITIQILHSSFYQNYIWKTIKSTYQIFIRYQIEERNVVCFCECKTNYSSEKLKIDKISVYHFPKDETEKEKWIKATPNANLRVSKDTVVCALHNQVLKK